MGLPTLLALIVTATVSVNYTEGTMRRVCYYTNWAQYRFGTGKFVPENTDPSLCTHIIYAFAKLVGNQLQAFEWNDVSTPWMKGMYQRFHDLKLKSPTLKTLLAVGGWNLGSAPFMQVVATQQSRAEFIQSSMQFLRQHEFDGLDVDWEYPANRGSTAADKQNYVLLIKEMREAFEQEATRSGKERLLVTAAIPAGKSKIDTGFDVPLVNRYLDFMNLMSYDLHGSWETYTGHHSALFPRAAETGDDRYLNVDFAAKYWVQLGASKEKLVIGMPLYGRSFMLVNAAQNGLGAPARQGGRAGRYTSEIGFLAYYEICQMIQSGATVHEDPEQHVRYLTSGDQWVGYEDEQSLAEKTCYVKQNGYGGVMIWALDEDDFAGSVCGRGPYPLLHAINNELNNPTFDNCPNPAAQPVVPQVTTLPPPQFTTQSPVTIGGGTLTPTNDFSCMNLPSDFYPSFHSCDEYYICTNQVSYRVKCATGLVYNPASKHCDWPQNVNCVSFNNPTSTSNPNTPFLPPIITTTAPTHAPISFHPKTFTTAPPQVITTTSNPNQPFSATGLCAGRNDGVYRDPTNCHQYIQCVMHMGYVSTCPNNLVFNQGFGNCQPLSMTPECSSTGGGGVQTPSQTPPPTTTAIHLPPTVTTTPRTLPPITTQPPTQAVTTSPQPNQPFTVTEFCKHHPDGQYRMPSSCNLFIECLSNMGFLNHCPQGKVFNEALASCQSPYITPECADFHAL